MGVPDMVKEKIINIAVDFTDSPGARFRSDGPSPGESFRDDYLLPALNTLSVDEVLVINFDGTFGYPPSFLEEAFGGLVRAGISQDKLNRIRYVSDEEPGIIEEIDRYINNAKRS